MLMRAGTQSPCFSFCRYAQTARELPPAPSTQAWASGYFFQWSAGTKASSARPTEMGSLAWPQSLPSFLEMEETSPN